jgi:ABC-2 type transport system permease protein
MIQRAVHAEWTKLRTAPSTGWTVMSLVVLTVLIGGLVSWDVDSAACDPSDPGCDFDLVRMSLSGVYLGQVAAVALAVLAVTAEYDTAMIRTTLTAFPRRVLVTAGKALTVAGVVLVTATVSTLASWFAGRSVFAHNGFTATPSLGDGPALRAYAGTVLYLGLVALLSLGLGFLVRHTGAAVTLVLGVLYILPIVSTIVGDPDWKEWIDQLSPMTAGLAIQHTLRLDTLAISPWSGLGVLALYASGSMIAGALAFHLRDS